MPPRLLLCATLAVAAAVEYPVLGLGGLASFYAEVDATKAVSDVMKVYAKCLKLSKSDSCEGAAASDLADKLEQKFGAAPDLDFGDDDAYAGEDEEDFVLPLFAPPASGAPPERVVIVGAGPAGLSAALYAARAGLKPVVVAPSEGGQLMGKGVSVENYPGILGQTGPTLCMAMQEHAAEFGARFLQQAVVGADLTTAPMTLTINNTAAPVRAHAVIVATGADSKWLGVKGEHGFRGGGVTSCATCDGFLYRDKPVAVIGGGDTAMEDALVLARTSASVTIIHRRGAFRASHTLAQRVLENEKITVRWNATVAEFVGDASGAKHGGYPTLEGLIVEDVHSKERETLDVAAAFVAIGHAPNTGVFAQLQTTREGYLVPAHDEKFATRLAPLESPAADARPYGVFAAGDVADSVYRQAITSAGSGAMAALDAERFLSEYGLGADQCD